MKFNVTFRSTFPVNFDTQNIGKELAEFLAQKLRESGLEITRVDNHDDFAWDINDKYSCASLCRERQCFVTSILFRPAQREWAKFKAGRESFGFRIAARFKEIGIWTL